MMKNPYSEAEAREYNLKKDPQKMTCDCVYCRSTIPMIWENVIEFGVYSCEGCRGEAIKAGFGVSAFTGRRERGAGSVGPA